jgi:hypothetical protein
MKRMLMILTVALIMVVMVIAAAMPSLAAITQVNGGGNTPNGNANGIPATNPAGHAPPGQN